MKELEKTKRISIATTLFILIVLIALLAYKRPKYVYAINTAHTLEKLISNDYLVSLSEINNDNFVLVDIRNQFEFEKGHIENAINIYSAEILNDMSSAIFEELKDNGKTAILYGTTPTEVNASYLLLYQLGYDVKILAVENSYLQNKLITKDVAIEKSAADIKVFIAESIKTASENSVTKVTVTKKPVKRVITVKKKKKAPAEGGC